MSADARVDRDRRQGSIALTTVLEQVQPQLVKMLKAYRIPLPDSEDLMQDAMLALVTGWTDIRDPGAWLVGALRNLCRSYVRRQSRSKVAGADLEHLERLAGAVPDAQAQHGARLDLERLVGELRPQQRRLVWLSFGLGLDAHELAQLLGGTTPASVRQARRRALSRLRELIAAQR